MGFKQAGFLGSLVATLGIVFPSFVIIFVISMFLDYFLEITWISNAFHGIKIAVGILILDASLTMVKKMKRKILPFIIMTCSFVVMLLVNIFSWNISSICLMSIAAIVSLFIFVIMGAPE